MNIGPREVVYRRVSSESDIVNSRENRLAFFQSEIAFGTADLD